MKNRLAKNIQHGFTLVELLVVIGILGILAAALLAVIDPIEQLNKAADQSKKNAAVEYVGAMQRYFATKQEFPMATTGCGDGNPASQILTTSTLDDLTGATNDCTDLLIQAGELKSSFTSLSDAVQKSINVTKATGVNAPIFACFTPNSKAYKNDPLTKYNDDGSTAPACTVGSNCHWCAQ